MTGTFQKQFISNVSESRRSQRRADILRNCSRGTIKYIIYSSLAGLSLFVAMFWSAFAMAEVGRIEVRPISPMPFQEVAVPARPEGESQPRWQRRPEQRAPEPRRQIEPTRESGPCAGAQTLGSGVADICAMANRHRDQSGLPQMRLDPDLSRVAQNFACDMARRGFFDHTSPDGLDPFDRMRAGGVRFSAAAENIAKGYRSHERAFQGWLDSSGHRRNLDNPTYRRQGVGVCAGHWVHLFAN